MQDLKRHSLVREQQSAPWAGDSDSEEGAAAESSMGSGYGMQQESAVLSACESWAWFFNRHGANSALSAWTAACACHFLLELFLCTCSPQMRYAPL